MLTILIDCVDLSKVRQSCAFVDLKKDGEYVDINCLVDLVDINCLVDRVDINKYIDLFYMKIC